MDRAQALSRAREVLDQEIAALETAREALGEEFVAVALLLGQCPGMVWTTGVGTSACVAQRFAHILNCCGCRAMFLSPCDGLHGHAGVFRPGDVLVALSRGGESAEVNKLVELAKANGVTAVAFVHDTTSSLARVCDHVLPIRSEQDYELQRVIATTSTVVFSAVCDALAAVVWELTGYTLEAFARTHPGGAVGKLLCGDMREEGGKA